MYSNEVLYCTVFSPLPTVFSEASFRVFITQQFVVKGYHCKPVDINLHKFYTVCLFRNPHFLTDYQHQQLPKFSDSMKLIFLSFGTKRKYFFPSEYLGELWQ